MITLEALNTMPSSGVVLKVIGLNGNVEFDHSISLYLVKRQLKNHE